MADTGNLLSTVSDIGGAVGDLFGSQGAAAEANTFQGAATLESQNAQLTAASTHIQESQTARAVNQSLGTTVADVAGAGFTESGSALDILRDSAQQGSLAKSLVNIQGAITENSYAAQAGIYSGEAKAANEQSQAGVVSAIASIGGAAINLVGGGYKQLNSLLSGSTTQGGQLVEDTSSTTTDLIGTAAENQSVDAEFAAMDAQSVTDTAVDEGAAVNGLTSEIPLGATEAEATTGIEGVAADSSAADIAASVGGAISDAAAVAADAAAEVTADVASAAAGVGSFIEGAAEVIGAFLGF